MDRFCLTLAPGGENHTGMELLGERPGETKGFSYQDLEKLYGLFHKKKYDCKFLDLNALGGVLREDAERARVLIVRNFVRNSDDIKKSLEQDQWDKKYFCVRRKKVLNKLARHNLCYMKGRSQEPDYENGRGRIVDLTTKKKLLQEVERVTKMINKVCPWQPKVVEGNHYYDSTTGIGFHGDTERKSVVAFSIGRSAPIRWQWFCKSKSVGDPICVTLNDSDMYIMSEKAVGTDWKKRNIMTLRHAAGAEKYIKFKRSYLKEKKEST